LNHYNISQKLISFNAVSEKKKISNVIERIKDGNNFALVSDAGTPTISDPGIRLVSEAIKEGIDVVPIPGTSAVIAALTISGLPTNSFVFEGFIPQKKGRQKKLKQLAEEKRTIILYESTYRIQKLINELDEYLPERYVVICRELTKKFEETWRGYPGKINEVIDEKISKGEFVVVIAPSDWEI